MAKRRVPKILFLTREISTKPIFLLLWLQRQAHVHFDLGFVAFDTFFRTLEEALVELEKRVKRYKSQVEMNMCLPLQPQQQNYRFPWNFPGEKHGFLRACFCSDTSSEILMILEFDVFTANGRCTFAKISIKYGVRHTSMHPGDSG